jgi:tripartite-type tricarboxylate transporter receptor subunit TctC
MKFIAALFFSCAVFAAHAQIQGGKPVRLINPYTPGASSDVMARLLSERLSALLKTQVIVENRPGAGGTVGTGSVAKAAPDGTTLVLAAASHTIAGSLYSKLAYDPIADFTGVAHIGSVDYVLMIHADVPAKTVREFIAHGKSNPGKLNYATAGNGSATHLSMAYLAGLAGIEMVHIPFKATGEAVNEVLAGRAHAVIAANIGALPYVKDSRVRMLGATGAQRSKFLPDLPAIAESLPGYEFDSWIALLAPAATPRPVVEQLNAAVAGMLKDPVILGRLDRQGVVPQAMTPDALNALLRADFQKMARVVKASGARID